MADNHEASEQKSNGEQTAPASLAGTQRLPSGNLHPEKSEEGHSPAEGGKPPLNKMLMGEIRLLDVVNAVISIGMLIVAIAAYRVASDVTDIHTAINAINGLAAQTKRQADTTDKSLAQVRREADAAAAQTVILGQEFQQMKLQTGAFQESAVAAQGQLQAMHDEQRPYVGIESVQPIKPLTFDKYGALLWLTFTLKNAGHSTAELTDVKAELYARSDNRALDRQKQTCQKHRRGTLGKGLPEGFNIMPGNSQTESGWFRMGSAEFAKWKGASIAPGAYGAIPTLVGCVEYFFGSTRHTTPFVYEVDQRTPGGLDTQMIDPTKGDIAPNELIMNVPPWFVARPQ